MTRHGKITTLERNRSAGRTDEVYKSKIEWWIAATICSLALWYLGGRGFLELLRILG